MPVARKFLLYYLRKDVDELPGDLLLSLDGAACRPGIGPFLRDVADEPTWSDVR